MTEPNSPNPENEEAPRESPDEHLPEWQRIFGELRDEAERLYLYGRLKILLPGKRRLQPKP